MRAEYETEPYVGDARQDVYQNERTEEISGALSCLPSRELEAISLRLGFGGEGTKTLK